MIPTVAALASGWENRVQPFRVPLLWCMPCSPLWETTNSLCHPDFPLSLKLLLTLVLRGKQSLLASRGESTGRLTSRQADSELYQWHVSMWISRLSPKNTHLDSFIWTWVMQGRAVLTPQALDKADHAFYKQTGEQEPKRKRKTRTTQSLVLFSWIWPSGPWAYKDRRYPWPLGGRWGAMFCVTVADGNTLCEQSFNTVCSNFQHVVTFLLVSSPISYLPCVAFWIQMYCKSNFPFSISRKW